MKMKKNEYLAPEMEIVELEVTNHLLAISDGNVDQNDKDDVIPGFGGVGD